MKVARTIAGMLVASALLCAGNLCINASKEHGKVPYISVTVTFLIEVLKLTLSVLGIVATGERVPANLSLRESLYYAVPSFLYMIDNNLTYVILRFVDPATLSVLWNLKILTTAVLFRFVLKRPLSEIRKIAIALLLLGVVTSQSDHLKKDLKNAKPQAPETDDAAAAADSAAPEDAMLGILLVLVAVTISSCASVFTEWAFKRKGACAFLWQNTQLYGYGVLFNSAGLLFEASAITANGFFAGYNRWTIAVIAVNCVGGLCMGAILKFLDNIACVYSHAIAMMLTMLVSMLFFRFSPSLEFGCGLAVLLISMYLYHHKVDTSGYDSDDSDDANCHDHQVPTDPASFKPSAGAAASPALPAGLHQKKKLQYAKVPDDSDLEMASPVSSAATERSSHRLSD
ncbi:hypothetical protein PybrP1_010328 [[Pythium] brassicae (nom. inval.)]|nr:hypothetical protein PybrP1_010328 [[Pythium] brassicae (nom. inval.)]